MKHKKVSMDLLTFFIIHYLCAVLTTKAEAKEAFGARNAEAGRVGYIYVKGVY